jgi:N-acetylmuramoyl-L-alanine amidase
VRSTPRVGIQIGHLRSNELPDELERLRNSTGAYFAGISESTLNGDIAVRVKALLEARGVEVELIPATVPPSYDVDAFVAIHADGIANGVKRGWKLATPWRTSPASQQLLRSVAESYPNATGMPEDVGGVTVNMRGYYAFAWRRHQHAVARTTPALIVEMGFLTSAADREIMIGQPDRVARGIADGILNYLDSGVWRNAEARVSPDFKLMQPKESGIVVRTRPSDLAGAVLTIGPDARFLPFLLENGWYEGVVRGEWRAVGWIRADQLTPTDDQMVIPTPTGGG